MSCYKKITEIIQYIVTIPHIKTQKVSDSCCSTNFQSIFFVLISIKKKRTKEVDIWHWNLETFINPVYHSQSTNEQTHESVLCPIKNNYPQSSKDTQRLPVLHVKQIPSMELGLKWPINIPHKGGGSFAIHKGETTGCPVTLWLKIRLVGSGPGTGDGGRKEQGWGFHGEKD